MVAIPDVRRLSAILTSIYGLPFVSTSGSDENGSFIDFKPVDLEASEGFTIRVRLGWRSISALFLPGNFSARLINTMSNASQDKKEIFKTFAKTAFVSGGELVMQVNDSKVSPLDPSNWPDKWSRLVLSLKYFPVITEELSELEMEEKIITSVSRMTGMVLSLLPLEEVPSNFGETGEGLP